MVRRTYGQLLNVDPPFSYVNLTLNGWYDYGTNSTEIVEASFAEVAMPTGDVEPAYDGSGHYGGNEGQQLRETQLRHLLGRWRLHQLRPRGLVALRRPGAVLGGLAWRDVPSDSHTIQQSYVWSLIDEYVADATWAPTSSFVTTGEGSGDDKAAIGASDTAAIAYFPTIRSVVVDTTLLGTDNGSGSAGTTRPTAPSPRSQQRRHQRSPGR